MSITKDSFKFFLESWIDKLNTIISQLESVPLESVHEAEHKDLISTFMEHQESLFLAKRELVMWDPFVGVCLPWINSLSRVVQWFGGWRPTVAYHVADISRVVCEQQELAALQAMRLLSQVEESAIEKEKRHTQSKVSQAFITNRHITSAETAFNAAMERVAVAADMARMEAVKRIVDVLPPAKAVVYLAGLGKMEANFYEVQV